MPGLSRPGAPGRAEPALVLEAAVPITVKGPARFLEELAGHMAAHPDALTSGDTRGPPVLPRLTHDEAAVAVWKAEVWPEIKEWRGTWAPMSASRTRQARG
jgi:hypothetical protein